MKLKFPFPFLSFVFVGVALPLSAQTIYVPGGTLGTSSTGNVGIGTAAPAQKLHLQGTGATWMQVNDSSYSSIAYFGMEDGVAKIVSAGSGIAFRTDGNGWSDKLTITNTGNVGVGTTTPGFKLDVADRMRLRAGASGTAGLFLYNGTTNIAFIGDALNGNIGLWGNACSWGLVMNTTTGNVGIGTSSPSHKLAVNGTIRAKEVIVDTGWSDYVFAEDYRLAPLAEVEAHILLEKHLPGIPTAAEVAADGISLGDMQSRLLAKIEELTLHLIEQDKRIGRLETENSALRGASKRPASAD